MVGALFMPRATLPPVHPGVTPSARAAASRLAASQGDVGLQNATWSGAQVRE
jgi:hypothetical protein